MGFFGITSKNEAQKAAMQAACNDKPYLFLTGPAGGGKTITAQAVGLEHTIEERKYQKLVYTRNQVQMGVNIGALPGEGLEGKTMPFMKPFMDNLDAMSDKATHIVRYAMAGDEKAKVRFESIQFAQGGTQHYTYYICDESQNNDPFTQHGLATRLGHGSKFIFTGNFSQIASKAQRNPNNNGFYQLLNGLYEEEAYDLFDHINFTETVRHPAIETVERILRNHEMPPEFEALERKGNV